MEKLRIFEAVIIFSSRLAYYEVKVIQQKKKSSITINYMKIQSIL